MCYSITVSDILQILNWNVLSYDFTTTTKIIETLYECCVSSSDLFKLTPPCQTHMALLDFASWIFFGLNHFTFLLLAWMEYKTWLAFVGFFVRYPKVYWKSIVFACDKTRVKMGWFIQKLEICWVAFFLSDQLFKRVLAYFFSFLCKVWSVHFSLCIYRHTMSCFVLPIPMAHLYCFIWRSQSFSRILQNLKWLVR